MTRINSKAANTAGHIFDPATESAIAMAATHADPVLIQGETGTGKEIVAEAIHHCSGRRGRLEVVNCATLSRDLATAILFGHARGAYTGAATASVGLFGTAEQGTLLLDEIGELDLPVQAMLLRAIDKRRVAGVGMPERPVNVRILAATHVQIPAAVALRTFREDLYHRLAADTIRLPPLRARLDQLPALCRAILASARAELCHEGGGHTTRSAFATCRPPVAGQPARAEPRPASRTALGRLVAHRGAPPELGRHPATDSRGNPIAAAASPAARFAA